MNYKDFYKPDVLDKYRNLELLHLLNKYESSHGIAEVIYPSGAKIYRPINTKEVLIKLMDYWNDPNVKGSAIWYYIKDIIKRAKIDEDSNQNLATRQA